MVVGVVAYESLLAFGGAAGELAFDLAGMASALMECFSRGIAVSLLTIKANRVILPIPPRPLKRNPFIHNLHLRLMLVLLPLPLSNDDRARSANSIIVHILPPIVVFPLASNVHRLHPIALDRQFDQIPLTHLTVIIRNLGARTMILLLPSQTSMQMIFVIDIFHHFGFYQSSTFLKLFIRQGIQLNSKSNILKPNHLPRTRCSNRPTLALDCHLFGQYGRRP
mmetsp:Transcript_12252/g.21500  ORF Transcript_12252/g.21500 Transcript_12252/m.21500 type:complete len:223 (-) Transcript_12252:870-1538(-)